MTDRDGTPLPTALSGNTIERVIRLDSALLYLVNGALAKMVDYEPLEQTGALTVEAARAALSAMFWVYLTEDIVAPSIVGEYKMFAFKPAPAGWLQCNGQVVLRATYAALFAVIGTNFNLVGEDETEFRLPLFDAKLPVGAPIGAVQPVGHYGEAYHVLLVEELPPHSHAQTGRTLGTSSGGNTWPAGSFNMIGSGTNTGSTGGGAAISMYPPVQEVNLCIYAGEG